MSNEAEADDKKIIPMPEVTDEHREKAKEMAKSYDDDRPTAVLPGTGHTVTGQAVNEWLDEDGNPKEGEVAEDGGIKREDQMGTREQTMNKDGDDAKTPKDAD